MADETPSTTSTKRSYTAPKGRPTRARRGGPNRGRVFGPVTQWVVVVAVLVIVVAVVIALTNGGDFNPLNDDRQPSFGAVAAAGV